MTIVSGHVLCSCTCNIEKKKKKKRRERIKSPHLKFSLKFQCLHPFSQSKISLLLNVAIQVSFVMHLGLLSQLCFGSMSPVVSAQTAVYWSLPTLAEVKVENTDVKLAMNVGVHQRLLTLLCSVSRFSIRHYIGS